MGEILSVKLMKMHLSRHRRVPYSINRVKVNILVLLCVALSHTHMHMTAYAHISDSPLSHLVEL